MASYNSNQLYGAGAPIEALTSGSTYTFAVTSSASGSTYFTLETVRNPIGYYDSSSPATATGIIENLTNITGVVASPYIFSAVVQPGGGSFTFTPATNVVASGSFLRGTGEINLNLLSPVIPFTFSEIINTDGATITETNVGPLTIEARATSFQVDPYVSGYIKVNGNTIKTTTDGSRGHTLAVLNSNGSTVGSITTYDTFGESPAESAANLAALTSALNLVAAGNYVVLVSWDACAVNQGLRDMLRNSFGATLTTTWTSTRYSHIFIGKKN
jgi:hypothetical protein